MATRDISIETQVIQKLRLTIVDRIATSAGPLWLSQKLPQEDFMSTERASGILNTMGFSSSDKVSQMMEAVESKIKRDPSDPSEFFGKFVAIVESEPALGDVCKALDDCYQELCRSTPYEEDLEAQLLLRARVQDEDVADHLMPLGAAVNGVLVGFCTMQSSFIFITTAVFVHPGKTFWEAIAIVALITGGAIGVLAFIGGIYAMYMADWNNNTQPQHGSSEPDFQFFIPEIVGNNLAAIVGLYFMFQALSLSRIATLTEAKRYVLFIIIVLLYMGYCIYGISEGLVTGATVVICAVVPSPTPYLLNCLIADCT